MHDDAAPSFPDSTQIGAVEVVPSGPLSGNCRAPSSKSLTNRLLLIAALAEGTSHLTDVLSSDDTAVMIAALRRLGCGVVDVGGGAVEVQGANGNLSVPDGVIYAGLSGTTLRWLSAAALLVRGTVVLDGAPPLRRRPMTALIRALETLGARVEADGGRPPLRITSRGLRGGQVRVDAAASSQFVTSLLLVGPYGDSDLEIQVDNLGAEGYVRLTLEAMARWGARVGRSATGEYKVAALDRYKARDEAIEYDASAACHLFALAMATGGSVTVLNAVETSQPDAGLTAVFAEMGGALAPSKRGGVTVTGPAEMSGVDIDVASMPDQVPTLAALGALARGTTRLRNASIARGHETDRVAAIARELRKLGASVEEERDTLTVRGGRPLVGTVLDTYDDHRMAMALSSVAAVVPGVVIREPGCVKKTYPAYWRDAAALGLRLLPFAL